MIIQSTVLTHCVSILQKHVSVVVLAGLDSSTVGWRVSACVIGLSSTGSGALRDIEGTLLEDADAEVGVLAVAVEGCVDGCVAQVDGIGVARRSDDFVVHVAV